jgi:hypothetical protein
MSANRESYFITGDKYLAMLLWVQQQVQTLEVPITYPVPRVRFLPDNLPPKHTNPTARYFKDGGAFWPDRFAICERTIPLKRQRMARAAADAASVREPWASEAARQK